MLEPCKFKQPHFRGTQVTSVAHIESAVDLKPGEEDYKLGELYKEASTYTLHNGIVAYRLFVRLRGDCGVLMTAKDMLRLGQTLISEAAPDAKTQYAFALSAP